MRGANGFSRVRKNDIAKVRSYMSAWTPYIPTPNAPWNLERVVHLHRRAAFGASWSEIRRDLADGPEASITRVLDGTSRLAGVPDDFENIAGIIGAAAVDSGGAERLKAWWLYRCLFSPHPLHERLTLMWHNHFATSNVKVNELRLMKRQNETFRRLAFRPFGELLQEMVHDPALLTWLDAPSNRKEHPNENLARELMELFTLGIGHYTEDDIKQAARALTGWTVRQEEFREQPAAHDDGEKIILGQTGNWGGSDLVKILLEQPHTPRRLAWRLTSEFCGEGIVDETPSPSWRRASASTSSTFVGESKRFSAPTSSSVKPTSARAWPIPCRSC